MEDIAKMKLENFRLPYEELVVLRHSLKTAAARLIGCEDYIDLFTGLIPFANYDEDGNFAYMEDLPEIFPSLPAQKTGAAVLFTGEAGCGKRTADLTFMSVVCQYIDAALHDEYLSDSSRSASEKTELKDAVEFYRLDFSAYDTQPERAFCDTLDDVLSQVFATATGTPYMLYYISLGDVTRILNNQKLTRVLCTRIGQLVGDPRSRCIITGIYDGTASQLKEAAKKPFFVLEFGPPAANARKQYFDKLLADYKNIRFACSSDELTAMTNSFTFAMIKRFAAYLLMTAKSDAFKKKLSVNQLRFASLSEAEKITITKSKIEFFADQIRQSRYTAPHSATGAPAIVYQTVPQTDAAPVAPTSGSESKSAKAEAPDDNENINRIIENINSVEDIDDVLSNLTVPSSFKPEILMQNRRFNASVYQKIQLRIEDFPEFCRTKGYTSLSNLDHVYLDMAERPALYPCDKNLLQSRPVSQADYDTTVIVKGKILPDGLARTGLDEAALQQLTAAQNSRIEAVFLGVYTGNKELILYHLVG